MKVPRLLLPLTLLALSAARLFAEPASRATYNFNPDWRFQRADVPAAAKPDFDDAKWTLVSVPHTWNDIDTFDNFGPGGHTGESEMWTGKAWYRKTFTVPAEAAGKRVIIEFEGVRQIADVYLNGHLVGRDETGFVPFGLDLTPRLRPGVNVLAVCADNRFDAHFAGDTPWNHPNWHPTHGGIYRNVRLHVLDPIHLTLPLYSHLGTEGVYAWTDSLTAAEARVGIEAQVENTSAADGEIVLNFSLVAADGAIVATSSANALVKSGRRQKIPGALTLPNPRLWEPASPHVYRLKTQLTINGVERDAAEIPYGPRVFAWDNATGFWINGKNVKLHGWGIKPTGSWAGLGAALPDWLRDYTFNQMAEAGGNMLRWGHSAGSATEQAFADRYGFVTIMPGVDGERDCEGKPWATRTAAFRSVIVYFRNNPSVFIWEGGNYNVSADHTKQLRGLVEQYDPKGNRYFGHRMSTPPMLPYIDIELGTVGRRRAFPMLPVVETEYDRIEAPRRLWDKFSPPDFGRMGAGEERNTYKNSNQETFAVNAVDEWWNKFESQPGHSGGANWIFHDEPHGSRQVTDTARATGEVDGVRLPKEAYYVLQTMWRDQPAAHLIGHWNYPDKTVKPIYAVIKGAETAELFLNDRSLGAGARSHHYLFNWPDVKFAPGKLRVVGRDASGKIVAEQTKETAGPAAALRLTPITAPGGWRADGSDVALVDVEIIDAQGRRCPTAQQRVDFEHTGPAIWRGGYNSGREGSTNHPYLDVECGINRVSLRATRDAGTVRLTARTAGLPVASVELTTQPFAATAGLSTTFPAHPPAQPVARLSQPDDAALDKVRALRKPPLGAAAATPPGDALFSSYAYTGDGQGDNDVPLASVALAYTDDALNYLEKVPDFLRKPETRAYRTALRDTEYWANDYIVGTAARDLTLYVAHDERLPAPQWLKEYKKLKDSVVINGVPLRLYAKPFAKDEVLRISGNLDQAKDKPGSRKSDDAHVPQPQGRAKLNFILFAQPR